MLDLLIAIGVTAAVVGSILMLFGVVAGLVVAGLGFGVLGVVMLYCVWAYALSEFRGRR